jgi:hypothetical protein
MGILGAGVAPAVAVRAVVARASVLGEKGNLLGFDRRSDMRSGFWGELRVFDDSVELVCDGGLIIPSVKNLTAFFACGVP